MTVKLAVFAKLLATKIFKAIQPHILMWGCMLMERLGKFLFLVFGIKGQAQKTHQKYATG